jgi:hypothetical protein
MASRRVPKSVGSAHRIHPRCHTVAFIHGVTQRLQFGLRLQARLTLLVPITGENRGRELIFRGRFDSGTTAGSDSTLGQPTVASDGLTAAAFDALPAQVAVLDADGVIAETNRA